MRGVSGLAQIILITSGAGGAGKSTVCALLGQKLAGYGKNVLIVEGSHRSLDVLFGVSDSVLFHLGDVLDRRCALEDAEITLTGSGKLRLVCAPSGVQFAPTADELVTLFHAIPRVCDFVLVEADGTQNAGFAPFCQRAVIVAAADRMHARACRTVSDELFSAGVADIRLCINMLPSDFLRQRPVPDLDWMIDAVCAQLIAVVPMDASLRASALIANSLNLSNISKLIFDNFAQRILGNYIDLSVY